MMIVNVQRLSSLILVIVLAGTLIACGGSNTTTSPPPADSGASTSGATTPAAGGGSDYRATVIKEHDDIAQSYNRFRGLMSNPLPTDMNWRTSVQLQLATWRRTNAEAQKLSPPPDMTEFHQQYLAGLAKFNGAADDITAALDAEPMDMSQFDSGVAKLTGAIQLLQGAMPLLGNQ
jgi:hypothetical protein